MFASVDTWTVIGHGATATRFGIGSRAEAVAYLEHDVLGARLRRCSLLLAALEEPSAESVMGPKYYDGEPDPRTLELLRTG